MPKGRRSNRSPAQDMVIAAMYAVGEPVDLIARVNGIRRGLVARIAKVHGVKPRSKEFYHKLRQEAGRESWRKRKARPEIADRQRQLVQAYQLGEKMEVIQTLYGVGPTTILAAVKKAGYPPRATRRTTCQHEVKMKFYNLLQLEQLQKNWGEPDDMDQKIPVVKLVLYDNKNHWLLVAINPNDPDVAYGLSDTGNGNPRIHYLSLSQLQEMRGSWGLKVERDLYFTPNKPLSDYAKKAQEDGGFQYDRPCQ